MTPRGKLSVAVTIAEIDMPRKKDLKRGGQVADMDSALLTIHCSDGKETIINMQYSRHIFPFPVGSHWWVYPQEMTGPKK